MLKDICAAVGRYTITACENTGRIMQLFLDTAARLKYANARETVLLCSCFWIRRRA